MLVIEELFIVISEYRETLTDADPHLSVHNATQQIVYAVNICSPEGPEATSTSPSIPSDYRNDGSEYYHFENMTELLEQKLSNDLCSHTMQAVAEQHVFMLRGTHCIVLLLLGDH